MPLAYRGYDLYIKDGGEWLWAASGATKPANGNDNLVLIKDMDQSEKECMLYLPIYSEVYSVKIGVQEGSEIEAIESPFRHRIGIFGSSYTHGISTSRAGMSYPMQLMDRTSVPQPRLQRKLQDAAIFCRCSLRCGCRRFCIRLIL